MDSLKTIMKFVLSLVTTADPKFDLPFTIRVVGKALTILYVATQLLTAVLDALKAQ